MPQTAQNKGQFCLAAVLRPCQSAALSDDHQNDTCQQYSAGQIVRDLSSQYAKKIYDLLEEFVDDLAEHSNAPQEAGLACTIFPQLPALRVAGKSMRFYTLSYNSFFFNNLKPANSEFFTQSSFVCILGLCNISKADAPKKIFDGHRQWTS